MNRTCDNCRGTGLETMAPDYGGSGIYKPDVDYSCGKCGGTGEVKTAQKAKT